MIRSIRSNLSIISLALLAVAVSATVAFAQGGGQMPPACSPGQQPTQSVPCMPAGGLKPCATGQQPTDAVPCMPSGSTQNPGQGGNPQQPGQGGNPQQPGQGGSQGGGNQGGGNQSPGMAPCEKGQFPTATKRCLIQPCEAGQQPSDTAPCIPSSGGGQGGGGQGGGGQGGGGDQAGGAPMSQPPPSEMNNKTFVMNVEVEGSGDAQGPLLPLMWRSFAESRRRLAT